MKNKSLIVVVVVLACGLAGCGVGRGLTGNSTGGIIPWTPENQAYARDYAGEHCARYGKDAVLGRIYARPGEYISFTCQFPQPGPSFRYSH